MVFLIAQFYCLIFLLGSDALTAASTSGEVGGRKDRG